MLPTLKRMMLRIADSVGWLNWADEQLLRVALNPGEKPTHRVAPSQAEPPASLEAEHWFPFQGGEPRPSIDQYMLSSRKTVPAVHEVVLEHNMVGESEALRETIRLISRVAPTDSTVLIFGESGTGKELAARAIHQNSPRAQKPFVAINCAAITETLLERDLFGYERGAFTGALSQKRGRLEMADGGTVFLDEIGEMVPGLQAKLLRVLQEREFERVGGAQPIRVDVRIIAATHRDLAAMVKQGLFRADLYYRLLVVTISVPPLRERLGDIPELVQYFFTKCKVKHGRPELTMPAKLLPYFSNYAWPGNVRQLEDVVERLVLLTAGPEIAPADLREFLSFPRAAEPLAPKDLPDEGVNLGTLERDLILRVLTKFAGDQTNAARYLGLSRETLAYRMKKHGIPTVGFKELKQE